MVLGTRLRTLVLLIGLACVQAHGAGSGNDLIPDIAAGEHQVRLEILVDTGTAPVMAVKGSGDGTGRLFIGHSDGTVRIFQNGVLVSTAFLTEPASPSSRAMSGLTFHPDFPVDPRFYVISGEALPNASTPHYVAPQDFDGTEFDNLLIEFEVDAGDPNLADVTTRRELLRIRQPSDSHNINDLTFDGDGYLLLAVGDGGNTRTGTPTHYNVNAADTTNPFGSILRIDVDSIGPNGRYGIPVDNPFADGAGGNVPEIYAWGVRNPWRMTTDRSTGTAYTGVNGDITIEWVLAIGLGEDYGWDTKEGSFLWNASTGEATLDPSPDPGITPPLGEYDHNNTTQAFGSIIGGFVYRGTEIPELAGRYLFHDWVAGRMVSMDIGTGAMELVALDAGGESLIPTSLSNSEITWGEGDDGELYLGRANGEVLRVLRSLPNVYVDVTAGVNGTGTQPLPFNNVADAIGDVATSGVVHLAPGSTSEVFEGADAIARSMTLQNENPGGGVVTIGTGGARSSRRSVTGFIFGDDKRE